MHDPNTRIHISHPSQVKMGHGVAMGLLVLGTFVIAQTLRTMDDIFLTSWTDAASHAATYADDNATSNATVL